MTQDIITTEQRDLIINSMQPRFKNFKSFKVENWKEGKLLLFKINNIDLIAECVYNDKDGVRKALPNIYSHYLYFRDLEEEYCVTLFENAKMQFKEIPTDIQVESKYKKLIEDLEHKGRLKIIEATDISIKLKLLRGLNP